MKLTIALSCVTLLIACASAHPAGAAAAQEPAAAASAQPSHAITITRRGTFPVAEGSADRFTGAVRMETLADPQAPAQTHVVRVTFAAGARTAWHSHPLGQVLIVTEGEGLVQQWDGPIQQIHPGDVVWISPNTKHWHGASAHAAMTHIAIYETPEGQQTIWMETVSDGQYRSAR